jgi:hypothetical protein
MRTQRRKFCDVVMAAAAPTLTPRTAKKMQSGKTMAAPSPDGRLSGCFAATQGTMTPATIPGTGPVVPEAVS